MTHEYTHIDENNNEEDRECAGDEFTCEYCENTFCTNGGCGSDVSDENSDGNISLCTRCRDRAYRCDQCEQFVHEDEANTCHRCDTLLCEECYENNHADHDNGSEGSGSTRTTAAPRARSVSNYQGRTARVRSTTFEKTMGDPRFFGFEMELIKCTGDALYDVNNITGSAVESDGSVGGINKEVQTRPLQGDAGMQHLKMVTDILNTGGAEVDKSCGLHIHLDATDMSKEDVAKAMLLYYETQHHIFSTLPNTRRDNHFCYPITPQDINKVFNSGLETYLYGENTDPMTLDKEIAKKEADIAKQKSEKHNTTRYCFFNAHAFFYCNTLEIRCHSGSTDFRKLSNWALINMALLKYARQHSAEEIMDRKWSRSEFLEIMSPDTQKYIKERWAQFRMMDRMFPPAKNIIAGVTEMPETAKAMFGEGVN